MAPPGLGPRQLVIQGRPSVVELDTIPDYESGGYRFESCRRGQ
jgi:hypothetical protein